MVYIYTCKQKSIHIKIESFESTEFNEMTRYKIYMIYIYTKICFSTSKNEENSILKLGSWACIPVRGPVLSISQAWPSSLALQKINVSKSEFNDTHGLIAKCWKINTREERKQSESCCIAAGTRKWGGCFGIQFGSSSKSDPTSRCTLKMNVHAHTRTCR